MQTFSIPSPNYDQEFNREIKFIIIHYTELDLQESLKILTCKDRKVSSHYLIAKNGDLYILVKEKNIAWHAGKSFWSGYNSLNKNSIGIEIENNGKEPYDKKQINCLENLIRELKFRYKIKDRYILGHSDIAPERKSDPGIFFPWKGLYQNGIGIYYNNELALPAKNFSFNLNQVIKKLSQLGYYINYSNIYSYLPKLLHAFNSHFYPEYFAFHKNLNHSSIHWDQNSEKIIDYLLSLYCKEKLL